MEVKMLVLANHNEIREAKNRQEDSAIPVAVPEKKLNTVTYVFRIADVVDCYQTVKDRMIIGFRHKEIEVLYDARVFNTIRGYINSLDSYALLHMQ